MKIPEKLRSLTPYDPTEDKYRIKLDANESFLPLPQDLLDRVVQSIRALRFHRYPDPACAALRETASKVYDVPAAQIVAGNGSDELISVIVNAFVPRGGRVLVADPDFSMYAFYAALAECEVLRFAKDGALRIDPDALIRAANEQRPDLLIFSNPCNPTGQGMPAADVLRVARAADCLVVVDEAYMEFWSESILGRLPELANVLVLRTCSKAFGLAGIRLGFALGPPELIGYLDRARSPFNVNALTQAVGAAVLSDRDYLRACAARVTEAADSLRAGARALAARHPGKLSYIPTVTNFALLESPRAPELYGALKARGICVRLIGGRYLRITAGDERENGAVLAALDGICGEGTI